MKKIIIPVQTKYEDTELITTLNVLDRNEIKFYLWSPEGEVQVKGNRVAIVDTHEELPHDMETFDGIFFPGGPAVNDLVNYDEILHMAKKFNDDKKIVAAICAGPEVLEKAGILENVKYTAYPGHCEGSNKTNDSVTVDGNIITGRDYESTIEFANKLVELIKK